MKRANEFSKKYTWLDDHTVKILTTIAELVNQRTGEELLV